MLGAIRGGLLRTPVDGYGHRTVPFRAVWTAVDAHRRRLEIYGSEGWGFESLRACNVLRRSTPRPFALQGVSVIRE
jgi:hypothetical protein